MKRSPARYALYASLALAGVVGVWLAIDALRERADVPAEQRVEIQQQATANMQAMQDRLAESLGGLASTDAQQRMDSPHGQALMRMCMEWSEFAENHPGEDTERARDDACRKLKAYVDDGSIGDPANDQPQPISSRWSSSIPK
jgi:hypothetical protein